MSNIENNVIHKDTKSWLYPKRRTLDELVAIFAIVVSNEMDARAGSLVMTDLDRGFNSGMMRALCWALGGDDSGVMEQQIRGLLSHPANSGLFPMDAKRLEQMFALVMADTLIAPREEEPTADLQLIDATPHQPSILN